MRRVWSGIKNFVFPPSGSPRWLKILPFALGGVLVLLVLYGSIQAWTYTNSSSFCGTSCHTMPPEYSAYLHSPHARVQCVECHIGRDVFTTKLTRKAGDLRHVLATITQNYEYPVRSHTMRPARDSCEKCHFPEKFSDDSLRELISYEGEDNSLQSTYLIMKTGGGSEREGLGRGIHWHIENEVQYLPTDDLQQDIPYVRVVDPQGKVTEYYDVGSGYTPELVADAELQQMDCITCHNRVTHTIPKPNEAVDEALKKGLLPTDLPFIREQALEALGHLYVTDEEGAQAIAGVADFYEENYPEIYAERSQDIQDMTGTLQDIYNQMVFRDQKIDWTTHPDNLGHKNDPGCFRCHDGKHLTESGEAIRLECNLCHSIPVIIDKPGLVTDIEISSGPEPSSHTHSNWISLHSRAIDSSCSACHALDDPTIDYTELDGIPPMDGSFCGNEACHGAKWRHAGFDTPTMSLVLDEQLTELQRISPFLLEGVAHTYSDTFSTLLDGRCVACHNSELAEGGLDLSSYEALMLGGNNGPALVPGDPANSLLVTSQSDLKDHSGLFLDDELEALEAWIMAGGSE